MLMRLPRLAPQCVLTLLLIAAAIPSTPYAQSTVATTASSVPLAKPESVGLSSAAFAKMDEGMQGLIDKQHLAGIVTLVARHGKVVQYKAYGTQDLQSRTPMRTDTIARIYSMTKPVTGVAMMMLYEEGKWKPSDPIAKHIPEFANLKVYVPEEKLSRVATIYSWRAAQGALVAERRDPQISKPPLLPSGGGGLFSTAADYFRFAQMLLGGGQLDGKRLLNANTVEMMRTNILSEQVLNSKSGIGQAVFSPAFTPGLTRPARDDRAEIYRASDWRSRCARAERVRQSSPSRRQSPARPTRARRSRRRVPRSARLENGTGT
jgi:CubicO group peptidase (beta-lactamase class C family)